MTVRAVHLGLGAFHRAHQAWYTGADPDWRIAAYTFRSTTLPAALRAQGYRYHLLVRGDGEPRVEAVDALERAHPGTDTARWCADLADESVGVLTTTITEAGYHEPETLRRLLTGLRARFHGCGAPITLVPCDNLPGNGAVLRAALTAAAEEPLATWLRDTVSIVDTVVDRITPATTEADRAALGPRAAFPDAVPVVTEPYTEWLLCGDFPHGRPAWERAGTRLVTDIDGYQRRKLWLLNGAHSLLAYTGLAAGHRTVDEAIGDPRLSGLTEQWWDTAAAHLPLPAKEIADYRAQLRARFATRAIRHRLAQIAVDGSQKIPARILPVLAAERAAGRLPAAAVAVLAAWLDHLGTDAVTDTAAATLVPLAARGPAAVLAHLAPDTGLADDRELLAAITDVR